MIFWILYPWGNLQHYKIIIFWRFFKFSSVSDFDLAQHFSCSVNTVKSCQIFFLACRQLRKKVQHNFNGQLKKKSDVSP